MPVFVMADAGMSGNTLPAVNDACRPPSSSCWVSVPSSKNRSISASSDSATSSINCSRAAWAASACDAGMSPRVNVPLPSV